MSNATNAAMRFEWKCPKCEAPAHGHGRGGAERCECGNGKDCEGFICECEGATSEDHGYILSDQCTNANCYHCGWGCTFPQPPKKAAPWEKKALEAGWMPPAKRAKELGTAKR